MPTKKSDPKSTTARRVLAPVLAALVRADQHQASASKAFTEACIAVHAGYVPKIFGTSGAYLRCLAAEANRSYQTFHVCWGIGLALAEGRTTKTSLLACPSRNAMILSIPPRAAAPRYVPPDYVSLRVTRSVHTELLRRAAGSTLTLNGVIAGLLTATRTKKNAA